MCGEDGLPAADPGLCELVKGAGRELGFAPEEARIVPLVGDGSDRRFYRVFCRGFHLVALVSPRRKAEGTDENDSYFTIGRHLESIGIPVPKVLWADVERGRFLMEDAGDRHLQEHVLRRPRGVMRTYERVLLLMGRLHRHGMEGFDPGFCFDGDLYSPRFVYERELEYFREFFLEFYIGLDAGPEDLRQDFEQLAEAAGVTERRTVIHRDFQSRNIMVSGGGLRLLDFQGMRYGPPAYDLASLLVDPYTALPAAVQERLAGFYRMLAARCSMDGLARFRENYAAVRLCRNLQILGAYANLGARKGKRQFLRFVPRAWMELRRWLAGPCRGRYPRLCRWVQWVQRDAQLSRKVR